MASLYQKINGVAVPIVGGLRHANSIIFESHSGLNSTNVANALDEVNTKIGNVNSNLTNKADKVVYSTSETNTGDKWIDNKPIFRKVISATVPSGSKTVIWSNCSIDAIISISGYSSISNGNKYAIQVSENDLISIEGNDLNYYNRVSSLALNINLIIEYTKL